MGTSETLDGRMVFIVGAMRSGTNWLQRLLVAHPDVVGLPTETHLFRWVDALAAHFQHGVPGSYRVGSVYMDRAAFIRELRSFCDAVFLGYLSPATATADRIVERTPLHARHLDLIGQVYPDASVIHIIRDGRDVARSLANQWWWVGDSIGAAAAEWRQTVLAARGSGPSLGRYREVRYEELLASPATALNDLFAWLGVAADADSVEAAVAAAAVPYNVDPSTPWVATGKWVGQWTLHELQEFESVAADLLADLGYSTPTDPMAPLPAATAGPGRRPVSGAAALVARAARRALGREVDEDLHDQIATVEVAEDFLDALGRGAYERAAALFGPTAEVRVADPRDEWSGRGPAAVRRLLDDLSAERSRSGPQFAGDVHPAGTAAVVVARHHAGADGVLARIWVVSRHGRLIDRVTYYRVSV